MMGAEDGQRPGERLLTRLTGRTTNTPAELACVPPARTVKPMKTTPTPESTRPTFARDARVGLPGIAALFDYYKNRPMRQLLDAATDPLLPLTPVVAPRRRRR